MGFTTVLIARERVTGAVCTALIQKKCLYIHLFLKGLFVNDSVRADCSGQFLQLKKEKTQQSTINAVVWDNTSIKILYDLRILTYIKEKASLTYVMNMLYYFHSCALKNSWALPKVIRLFQYMGIIWWKMNQLLLSNHLSKQCTI